MSGKITHQELSTSLSKEISRTTEDLQNKPLEPITLSQGVQVVQGGDFPAILHPTMKGRTLVNLLGRDGNCESLVPFTTVNGSVTLSTTQKKSGNNSIKLLTNNSASSVYKDYTHPLNTSKCYVFGGWAYIESHTSGSKQLLLCDIGTGNIRYSVAVNNSKVGSWQFIYAKLPTTNAFVGAGFRLYIESSTGTSVVYFDDIRLYEVSTADFNAIGTTITGEDVNKYFPYVDDMKHVNAVYIQNKGKNLIPPFSEWTLHANTVVLEPYMATLTATENFQLSYVDSNVVPGQAYSASVVHNGKIALNFVNELGNTITTSGWANTSIVSGIAPVNARRVRLLIGNDTLGAGTFAFSNPMLNIGSEARPFEPQQPSYLYLPDCNLRSNVDGNIADRLYTDGQGKSRVTRRFREMELDGSLEWIFHYDMAGFKAVKVPRLSNLLSYQTSTVIKFDGRQTPYSGNITNGGNLFVVDATHFYLSISDIDSGWGESYTPTSNEIKAYFYGWKMYNASSGDPSTKYNEEPGQTKGWIALDSNLGTWVFGSGVGGSAPLYFYNLSSPAVVYRPYRLMYQLGQSVDEPVTYEGALMLHEGDNQVEVGTGVVVQETVTPKLDSTNKVWRINAQQVNGVDYALLTRRTEKILSIFRNAISDRIWAIRRAAANSYGNDRADIPEANFDPTAAYSVTYLALDTHKLGIAPQSINAEYAPNIRESVESLVREVVEARTEASVLQNTKAQKQQPQWVAPALLNGWVQYGVSTIAPAGYMKNEQGQVTLRGMIKAGAMTSNTVLFYLPTGYRPTSQVQGIGQFGGAVGSIVQICIDSSGAVFLGFGITSNSWLDLSGVSFLAEQ